MAKALIADRSCERREGDDDEEETQQHAAVERRHSAAADKAPREHKSTLAYEQSKLHVCKRKSARPAKVLKEARRHK